LKKFRQCIREKMMAEDGGILKLEDFELVANQIKCQL